MGWLNMNTNSPIGASSNNVIIDINNKIHLQWIQHWDVMLFLVAVSTKVLYYGKQISTGYFSLLSLQPAVIASIFPIMALAFLFKEDKRKWFLYVLNMVISFILFADTVYYHYYKDIISIGVIKQSFLLKSMSSSIFALIQVKDLLYFIDLVILIPLIKKAKRIDCKQWNWKTRLIAFTFFLLLGAALDGSVIYKVSKEQPLLIKTMSNKLYLTKVVGNINFHLIDVYDNVINKIRLMGKIPEEKKVEIQTFLQNKESRKSSALTGEGKGKNLIVIQIEALQQFVINQSVNGQEITPNLNRWINKSLYFDNCFYQVSSGNTSDAEFMVNNSLYPAASGAAYYNYTGNTLNSLGRLLKDKGYSTAAFHGNVEGFWNRNVMYNTEGFGNFFGESSFKIDEKVGLGLSDRSFYNQTLDKMREFQQPFYSFIVSLSSHFPYEDGKGYGDFNVTGYEGTLMGSYLKGIHYADEQLGMFLDKLDKEGFADNSIIAIYGDHYAIPKGDVEQLYKLQGVTVSSECKWFQYQKVPFILHFPKDMNKGMNHNYSGQMDICPTLANIFELNNDYMLGEDLLNASAHKVIFRDGSYTDGSIYYFAGTNCYYDMKSGNQIAETLELKQAKEFALKELNYSDNILDHNLISILNSTD